MNINVYDNIDSIRAKFAGRQVDEYQSQLIRQNDGLPCSHCDALSGHTRACPLINREVAEARSTEYTDSDRAFLKSFRIKE